MVAKVAKRKKSIYLPEDVLRELRAEAKRLDRSLSWMLQRAWKIARKEIVKVPSESDVGSVELAATLLAEKRK